jgi:hypothetical protein
MTTEYWENGRAILTSSPTISDMEITFATGDTCGLLQMNFKLSWTRKSRSLKRLLGLALIVSLVYCFLPGRRLFPTSQSDSTIKEQHYILIGKDGESGVQEATPKISENQVKDEPKEIPEHLLPSVGSSVVGGESKVPTALTTDDEEYKKAKNAENMNEKVFKLKKPSYPSTEEDEEKATDEATPGQVIQVNNPNAPVKEVKDKDVQDVRGKKIDDLVEAPVQDEEYPPGGPSSSPESTKTDSMTKPLVKSSPEETAEEEQEEETPKVKSKPTKKVLGTIAKEKAATESRTKPQSKKATKNIEITLESDVEFDDDSVGETLETEEEEEIQTPVVTKESKAGIDLQNKNVKANAETVAKDVKATVDQQIKRKKVDVTSIAAKAKVATSNSKFGEINEETNLLSME